MDEQGPRRGRGHRAGRLPYNPRVPTGLWLEARELRKSFDGGLVVALAGASLRVAAGERVALTGPTGCGKTTLLALLALLATPDSGEILIDGAPASSIRSPESWRAREVGIVFQLHHLLPHLTVLENAMLKAAAGRAVDRRGRDQLAAMLERLGLAHRAHARANVLSGGERQLAALARALIGEPRLVLADEPTGSVDSTTGRRILEELDRWSRETGGTLLLATHDPGVAAWASREVKMLDGRIIDDA